MTTRDLFHCPSVSREYVALARYENAAAPLREADLRVSEIAFASGLQSQFKRIFKKFSGRPPTE